MTDSNATYNFSVNVDNPDYASSTVSFTVRSYFTSGNNEVIPGKTYSLTLDANGQGTQVLPAPDNTGETAVNWLIHLPSGEVVTAALAYSAAAQELSDILASASTTTDPDSITAALATKANKVTGATTDNFASLDASGDLQDSGFTDSDFDAAGSAAAAQAAAQTYADANFYNQSAFSATPTADEPLKADGSGKIQPLSLAVGSNVPSADDTSVNVTAGISGAINAHAYRDETTISIDNPSTGYASFDAQYTAAGTGNIGHLATFQNRYIFSGSGVLSEARGFWSQPTTNGTQAIPALKHFEANDTLGTGVVTNQYGFFARALTKGSSSNYAFYSLPPTQSWFSGTLNLGFNSTANGTAHTTGHLVIRAISGNQKQMQLGYNTTTNYGWIQAANYGTEYSPLVLNRNGGDVSIGNDTPLGRLHVDQSSATGAEPVLYLDQADVSEEIMQIASTAGVGNAIELVGAKTLTVTEFIKVTINGNTRYIAAGTIA